MKSFVPQLQRRLKLQLSLEEGTLVLRFYILVQVNYLTGLSLKQVCWAGIERERQCKEDRVLGRDCERLSFSFAQGPLSRGTWAFLTCVPN